jgi:hypothetical protein
MKSDDEPGLQFLLGFDGRVHRLEQGYWVKFSIRQIGRDQRRPHGLVYSLTLHAPDGARLIGFDNAHRVPGGSPDQAAGDHWHRTEDDPGRPYRYVSAETLLEDFLREVERVLGERGVAAAVIREEERRRRR